MGNRRQREEETEKEGSIVFKKGKNASALMCAHTECGDEQKLTYM